MTARTMFPLLSLPSEILDLVFEDLQPHDLKSLRLTNHSFRDQVGYAYLRHIVLTLHRGHLKMINAQIDSMPLARCVKQITVDCRRLQHFANLTRVVYMNDPMQLILQNHDHIGERYCKLTSEFLDIANEDADTLYFLQMLITIIQKLPNLRQVLVFEQTHYVDVKPIPHFISEEVKSLHPDLAPTVDDKLTKRMITLSAITTRLVSRTVILAVKTACQRKCRVELRTLYARYGDGGGPTIRGICDIVQHTCVKSPQLLVRKIRQHRKNEKGPKANQFEQLIDGSPVLLIEGCGIPIDTS